METSKIIEKVDSSINILFENDKWLIENDLSEQSISHKLGEYLQHNFPELNVDCEYNGNIDEESGRKRITVIKRELEEKGLLKKTEEDYPFDLIQRAVFPDIIVHQRGSNENNLCILEIKKTTSKVPFDYDKIKLSYYTTDYYGNDLKYDLGIFLLITTGRSTKKFEVQYYTNGKITTFV